MIRAIRLSAALLLAAGPSPAAADMLPPSSSHLKVETAEINELGCLRRPFKMENTRTITQWYPYMSHKIASSNWHPHTILLGIVGIVALFPMAVIAVPTDLVAAPFRRACGFKLRLSGEVNEWAGKPVAGTEIELRGANLIHQGVPELSPPEFKTFDGHAISDASGRFRVELDGSVGRDKALIIGVKLKGRAAGQMRLQKKSGTFVLTQPDAGFGVGAYEMEPLVIRPKKAPK